MYLNGVKCRIKSDGAFGPLCEKKGTTTGRLLGVSAALVLLLSGIVYRIPASKLNLFVDTPLTLPIPLSTLPVQIGNWAGKDLVIPTTTNENDLARYMAQVQISSVLENSVRTAAQEMTYSFLAFIPDKNSTVKAIEYSNTATL
jgi:hypothetical protein